MMNPGKRSGTRTLAAAIVTLLVTNVIAVSWQAGTGENARTAEDPASLLVESTSTILSSVDGGNGHATSTDFMAEITVDGGADAGSPGEGANEGSPGEAAPAGAAARLPAGPGVRGVTDTAIQIGLQTSNATAAFAVTGAISGGEAGTEGFSYDEANAAAVDAVNGEGGIAGRKVEPVYWFNDPSKFTTASGRQQSQQSACAKWTEDNHVFAFSAASLTEENIFECAATTKTPMVAARYHIFLSQQRFDSMSDYWYGPDTLLADRRERGMGRFLLAHDWPGEGAKIGILTEDKTDHREGVARGLKPVLAAAGMEPTIEILYPDYGSAPWSNYVLQLQSAGVTHVIWSATSTGSFAPLLMLQAAENQRYRPKWALGSDGAPAAVAALGAPKEQMANLFGMGWKPQNDIGDTTLQSATARICAAQLKKRGQAEHDAFGLDQCGVLFFLKAALERSSVVSTDGLAAGVAQLGDDFPATQTIDGITRFGPGRHDGAHMVRAVEFDTRCESSGVNCFKYATDPEPMPA